MLGNFLKYLKNDYEERQISNGSLKTLENLSSNEPISEELKADPMDSATS